MRGGTEAGRAFAGDDGGMGLVELGRFVHASSSNPEPARFELAADPGRGGTVELGLVVTGVPLRIWSDAELIALRSTVAGGRLLLGCGRPLRCLSAPLGPDAKRFGG